MRIRVRRGFVAVTVVSLAVAGCSGDDEDGGAAEIEQPAAEQVTLEEYHQIKKGWSGDEVRDLVGDPKSTERTNVEGLGQADCWYYGGVPPEPTTQICFEGDQVAFKTQYVDE